MAFEMNRFVRRYLTSAVILSAILIAVGWFSATPNYAAAPVLSDGGPANGATGQAVDATVSITSDVDLNVSTVFGWSSQTTADTSSLADVQLLNATTGFAVGTNSTVFATTNGGSSWTKLAASPSASPPQTVHFVDASTGWIAGNNGTIVKSADGGASWLAQTSGTASTLRGMQFLDANTGYVVGASGVILKTTNGGTTWSSQTSGTANDLYAVHCVDANTCWSAGGSGTIVKTTNGGTTWTAQTSGVNTVLQGVYAVDANTAYVVGASGVILKTTNGGTAWTSQTSGVSSILNAVQCMDASTCWVVGDSGVILKTTNGGSAWAAQTSGTLTGLVAASFSSADLGVAVGADTFLRYVPTVLLQANTGNTQGGAAAGANLCTSVTHASRTITCAHSDLSKNTWYTFTVTTGLKNSSSEALGASVTRAFRTIGAPAFSTASFTAAQIGVATDASLTFDFDNPLASATVTTANVSLQANTGNTRAGAASGSNLCTTVSLGNDGSGNSSRRITCTHGPLVSGTWYTLTVTGGSGGLTSTTNDALASTVTRGFRTSYGTDQAFDLAASDLSSLSSEGYLTVTGSESAASQATFGSILRSRVTTADGTALVTVPQSAVLTRTGGGTFDTTALSLSDHTASATSVPGTKRAVLQYGIPTVSLASSTAITIAIPIPSTVSSGTVLDVYRDLDGNFADATTPLTTCTVASSTCSFTTTALSYFAASEPSGRIADTTPPSSVRTLAATPTATQVTLTWTDPTDTDLDKLRVIRAVGDSPATALLGTVGKGTQRYVDTSSDLTSGTSYTYTLESVDQTGNRSSGVSATVTIPAPTPATTTTTTTPLTPSTGTTTTTTTTPSTATEHPTATTTPTDTGGLLGGTPTTTTSIPSPEIPTSTTGTTPTAPLPELSPGIAADEPVPVKPPKPILPRTPGTPTPPPAPLPRTPCSLTEQERAYLEGAFRQSQGREPTSAEDFRFLCALRSNPEHPVDPTKAFPKYRNLKAELFALKNFVNFFGHPPSRNPDNTPVPPEEAEQHWWAVKYMAYHLRLLPTARNIPKERACLKLFRERDVDLYKDEVKLRKPQGAPPIDRWDYDFIRACTYSGVEFTDVAGSG